MEPFILKHVFALYRLLNVIGHTLDNRTLLSTPFMSFLTNIFVFGQGLNQLCPITIKQEKNENIITLQGNLFGRF